MEDLSFFCRRWGHDSNVRMKVVVPGDLLKYVPFLEKMQKEAVTDSKRLWTHGLFTEDVQVLMTFFKAEKSIDEANKRPRTDQEMYEDDIAYWDTIDSPTIVRLAVVVEALGVRENLAMRMKEVLLRRLKEVSLERAAIDLEKVKGFADLTTASTLEEMLVTALKEQQFMTIQRIAADTMWYVHSIEESDIKWGRNGDRLLAFYKGKEIEITYEPS